MAKAFLQKRRTGAGVILMPFRSGQICGFTPAMLAASVWLVGCSQPDVRFCRIHGVVTIDGLPAREGVIRFEIVSAGDLPSGATIVDGAYEARLALRQ